jgi:hypothetical protein
MTRRSKKPVARTDEFKRKTIEQFENRGEQVVEAFAKERGISKQMIYEWRRRIRDGTTLTKRPGGASGVKPPKPPEPGSIAAKGPGVLMRARQAAPARASPPTATSPPTAPSLEFGESYLSGDRDEILLLRAEVRRLKRVLAACLELDGRP